MSGMERVYPPTSTWKQQLRMGRDEGARGTGERSSRRRRSRRSKPSRRVVESGNKKDEQTKCFFLSTDNEMRIGGWIRDGRNVDGEELGILDGWVLTMSRIQKAKSPREGDVGCNWSASMLRMRSIWSGWSSVQRSSGSRGSQFCRSGGSIFCGWGAVTPGNAWQGQSVQLAYPPCPIPTSPDRT